MNKSYNEIPIYDTVLTLEKFESIINEIFASPPTKTIYVPNKGLATIPLKTYNKIMFDGGCLICPEEIQDNINVQIIKDIHSYKLFSSKLLN